MTCLQISTCDDGGFLIWGSWWTIFPFNTIIMEVMHQCMFYWLRCNIHLPTFEGRFYYRCFLKFSIVLPNTLLLFNLKKSTVVVESGNVLKFSFSCEKGRRKDWLSTDENIGCPLYVVILEPSCTQSVHLFVGFIKSRLSKYYTA